MPPKTAVNTDVPRLRFQVCGRATSGLSNSTRSTSTRPDTPRLRSPELGDAFHHILIQEAEKEGEGLSKTAGKAVERPISLSSDEEFEDDIVDSPPDESWRSKLRELDIVNTDGSHVKKADDKTNSPLKRKTKEIDMRPYKKERLITSFGEVVTLLVGKDATKFIVHKDMLCAASPFFEAACKPEWQSANECVVALPEDDPMVVKILLNWVYENVIRVPVSNYNAPPLGSSSGLLLQLYVLGDKYRMPALQNDAMDGLYYQTRIGRGLGWQIMNYACKETLETDTLRLFLVNFAIRNWSHDKLESYKTHLCPEFTHRMAVELLKCPSTPRTVERYKDLYPGTFCPLFHRHGSTPEPKCKSYKSLDFFILSK